MKRVIIVPVTEIQRFPGMETLASGAAIAALVGDTFEARRRRAFDSEDSFFCAVAEGHADLYTFNSLEQAALFAKAKIEALTVLEGRMDASRADAIGPLRIAPGAVPHPGRRRQRA